MSDEFCFSLEQLMELAGLSCAAAVHKCYPPEHFPSVLVVAGPGNNGGDGLVAARHLLHFGYRVQILLPKQPSKDTYRRLVTQLTKLGAPFLASPPADLSGVSLLLDAVFGFSFDPRDGIRAPYAFVLQWMTASQRTLPVVSIDVPSGWHVEEGDVAGTGLRPSLLVSLTAPKRCARHFTGDWHAVGGRFVPPPIAEKYGLKLPKYSGREQFAIVTAPSDKT